MLVDYDLLVFLLLLLLSTTELVWFTSSRYTIVMEPQSLTYVSSGTLDQWSAKR